MRFQRKPCWKLSTFAKQLGRAWVTEIIPSPSLRFGNEATNAEESQEEWLWPCLASWY